MTIEYRKNSVALKCDCSYCHMELIRESKEAVLKEAEDEMWSTRDDYHECFDCTNNNCPGEVIAIRRFGQSSHTVITDNDVQVGDIVMKEGIPVGTAKSTAKAGDPVEASLVIPPFEVEGEDGKRRVATFFQMVGATMSDITNTPDRESIADKARSLVAPKRKEAEIDHELIDEVNRLFEDFDVFIGGSDGDPKKFN